MPISIHCPGCKATLRVREEHAGKSMKCPRCSAALTVPAADEHVVAGVVEEVQPLEDEPGPVPVRRARREPPPAETVRCPECGKKNPADRRKCQVCRARLDEDEDSAEEDEFVACPLCGAGRPTKVNWTWWGSFLGPQLFNVVSCQECDYSYNGRTGGSNNLWKIIFVTIPLLGIIGVIVLMFFLLKSRGVF